jgi:group I intron endonuclease
MLVYLLQNKVNGKGYVGQHCGFHLEKRWNQKLNNTKMNNHLQAAINKYGPANFRRTVLAYASCQQEADLLEKFFILIYQTTDRRFGYNFQSGGRRGSGRHIEEVRERIRDRMRVVWARKSEKERWEFGFATKLRWLNRTEEEKEQITNQITKSLVPSGRKGRTFGPQKHPCQSWPAKSEEHKKRISRSLKMYFAQKQKLPPKKPCGSVKQPYQNSSANRKEIRAMAALKEMELAKNQLREIQKRLQILNFELMGGCNW